MTLFGDYDPNALHVCEKCGGEFTDSEMANDEVCSQCDSQDHSNIVDHGVRESVEEMDTDIDADGDDDFGGLGMYEDSMYESKTLREAGHEDYVPFESAQEPHTSIAEILYGHDNTLTVKLDGEVYPGMTQFEVQEFLQNHKPSAVVDEPIFGDTSEHDVDEWMGLFNASLRETTCFDRFMDNTLLTEHKRNSRKVIADTDLVKYYRKNSESALRRIRFSK